MQAKSPKQLAILFTSLLLFISFALFFTWYGKHIGIRLLTPDVPQDIHSYIPKEQLTKNLINKQQQLSQTYLQHYFKPWSNQLDTTHFDQGDKTVSILEIENQVINDYSQNPIWGENMHRRHQHWIEKIINNMNLLHYPNQHRYAIATRNTNIRALPTHNAAYLDRFKAGEGYPFDTLQTTSLWAGTPLFIAHLSNDNAWALAISSHAFGWIAINDIAYVDQDFIQAWKKPPLATPIEDGVSILDANNVYHFNTHVGALYPIQHHDDSNFDIAIPVADQEGNAQIKTSTLTKTQATEFPMPATFNHIATIVNALNDEPYGWGGLFGYRDCSEMTEDFYSVFGLWLPRQSTAQLQANNPISLEHMNSKTREQTILNKAKPFLTLLGQPGHVMIYVGEYKGKPLVFHSLWGLHTHYPFSGEGRLVIGHTAITSLELGKSMLFTDTLMDKVLWMANLSEN